MFPNRRQKQALDQLLKKQITRNGIVLNPHERAGVLAATVRLPRAISAEASSQLCNIKDVIVREMAL